MQNIDWAKTLKKAGITASQFLIGILIAKLPIFNSVLSMLHVTQDQAVIALGSAIAGGLELLRSLLKQKTGWSWL